MNKYFYPIYKMKIKPWIKYWLLKKGLNPVVLSDLIEGTSPITIENVYEGTTLQELAFKGQTNQNRIVKGDNYININEENYRVDLGGKNIFNTEQAITRMENAGGTLINGWGTYEDGILTMNRSMGYHGACYFAGQKFNLEANKTYTLSATVYLTGTNTTSNVILGFEGASNPNVTITKETWTKVSKAVTFTEDKENVRVFIQPSNTGNVLQMKEIMLCEGTDTDYIPYNPIELGENDKIWNDDGVWKLNNNEITDTNLIEQLETIKNATLISGTNEITQTPADLPFILNFKYYMKG